MLTAGKSPPIARRGVGCPLPEMLEVPSADLQRRTSAGILQKNCQECHRPGQVGPFSLETYEQARKRAERHRHRGRVPPDAALEADAGLRARSSSTTSRSRPTRSRPLVAWAEAGTPEGDPADLPLPLSIRDDWALGTPDLVLEPADDFAIPAAGDDIYRCFVIPTKLPEDIYISAIEYRPGNRKVVHHVLSYVDTAGKARKRDEADPGPGYSCFSGPGSRSTATWAAGHPATSRRFLPDGIGRSLPKGADVSCRCHYHPSGKPETDRTRIGLYFSQEADQADPPLGRGVEPGMELPAGDPNIEVKAGWAVPIDVDAFAVTPHMHLLGSDMAMAVTYPDGRGHDPGPDRRLGLQWQNTYYFEKPIDIPRARCSSVVAHYDNSPKQPPQPQHAAQGRELGRGDDRRDVHRLPRRDQEGPGPDPARREGRPPRDHRAELRGDEEAARAKDGERAEKAKAAGK